MYSADFRNLFFEPYNQLTKLYTVGTFTLIMQVVGTQGVND